MGDFAEMVRAVLAEPEKLPAEFWGYTIQHRTVNPVASGAVSAPILASTGLKGATSPSRYVGATASGHPTVGTFQVGDFVVDQTGIVWICGVAGAPGTWAAANAPVSSVFGRAGAVAAAAGDYTAAEVTNAADKSSASAQVFAGAIGYSTGTGGSVSSATASATLNTICGHVEFTGVNIAAGAVLFVGVDNSTVAATDALAIARTDGSNIVSWARSIQAGNFGVGLYAPTTVTAATVAFNFAVIKATNS